MTFTIDPDYRKDMVNFFQNKRIVIIGGVLLGILILIFGIAGFFLTEKRAEESEGVLTKGISGIVNVNGVIPPGSTITLLQRETQSNGAFVPFAENIMPTDLNVWNFRNGKVGKSYEIQGSVVQNGQVIYLSDPIFVTAPAINQVVTFDVAVPNPNPTGPANAVVSGSVGINGYIPSGSTITLQARKLGDEKYNIVSQNLPAKDGQSISYTTAIAGQTYQMQAQLYDPTGVLIGESSVLEVTAPAANESLSINSIASPPVTPTPTTAAPTLTPTPTYIVTNVTSIPTNTPVPPTVAPTPVPPPSNISGSIQFNGQASGNSRITIFQRITGTSNFQLAVDNITPENNVTWQWNGAVTGQTYDLIAILKQRQSNGTDQDIANSNIITVAAPASLEVFTINSGYALSAPNGPITSNCTNYNSSNQTWNVTVSFGNMPTAQEYWIQIGTSNGGNQLTNSTPNATQNPMQSYNYTVQNGTTYYARYAYANVPNLMANDPQWSPFTATTQFTCSN